VEGKFVTPEIKALFTLPLSEGLLVEHVAAGSPAAEAGFQAGELDVLVEGEAWILGGDILVAIQGHPVRVPQDFVQAVSTLRVGQKVEIQFLRDGKAQRTTAVIRERPRKLLHMRGVRGTRPTAARSPSIVEETSRIAF
jgi:S1-C subfamily serine protease